MSHSYPPDAIILPCFHVNSVSQASGCSTEVTEDDVEEGEVDKLVKGLLQQVTQVAFYNCTSLISANQKATTSYLQLA